MMDLAAAQREISAAHIGGAPGVFMSALVWLVAGTIWSHFDIRSGFAALFFGGMLIVPASLVIGRAIFRAAKVAKGNTLERLGLEITFFLFAGLLIAYALLPVAPQFVFPVMAITIGTRYFAFRTLYGQPLYWLLAASIVAVGATSLIGQISWPGNLALVVGGIELIFAPILLVRRARDLPDDARVAGSLN